MRQCSFFLSLCFMIGLIFSLHGCSPITVQSDYDHTQDFSKYKTYAWTASDSQSHTRRHHRKGKMDKEYQALMDKRLKENFEEVLTSKGFTKTSPENADLLFMYHFGVKSKIEHWRAPRGGGGRSIRVPVTENNIVLEMMETGDQRPRLAWMGRGRIDGYVKRVQGYQKKRPSHP